MSFWDSIHGESLDTVPEMLGSADTEESSGNTTSTALDGPLEDPPRTTSTESEKDEM